MYYLNNFQEKMPSFSEKRKEKTLAQYYWTCGQLQYFINILIQ